MEKTNYIDNKEFYNQIVAYKAKCKEALEAGKPKPRMPDYIGKCIMLIAENLGYRPEFAMYSFKEEMVGDGIENCIMYFHNFNADKYKNPHAYFTTIVWYAFIRRIQKEKKQLYTKYKMIQQISSILEGTQLENEDGTTRTVELYDNINEFIGEYEKNTINKKPKEAPVVVPKKKKNLENFVEEAPLDIVDQIVDLLDPKE
jgi:hypothetical protein